MHGNICWFSGMFQAGGVRTAAERVTSGTVQDLPFPENLYLGIEGFND